MFRLHERTRLLLCRAGFLILCLGPTVFLAAAAARYRSPSYMEAQRDEWAAVLSDKLGVDVRFSRLSYPLWDTALLEELQLLDPETGEELLQARYVELTHEDAQWRMEVGQPEINSGAMPELIRLIDNRLMRGHALQLATLKFAAREVTFHSQDGSQTFQAVAGDLRTVETGKRADVQFHLAGSTGQSPLRLITERRRTNSGVRTTCELDTAQTLLPCGALMPLAPWVKDLGSDASFRGTASFEIEGDKSAISGLLTQVNLSSVMSVCFPQYKLTGLADIQLDQLKLAHGKILEVAGTLQSRGGDIDRELLSGLQRQLDLDPPQRSHLPLDSLVRYSQLAFGFRLDHEGLSLSGDANPANAGVIMSRSTAILLVEPPRPVAPVAYLVKVLSPESDVQIPATSEAKSLLSWLPMPAPVASEEETVPRAKNIRLTERSKSKLSD